MQNVVYVCAYMHYKSLSLWESVFVFLGHSLTAVLLICSIWTVLLPIAVLWLRQTHRQIPTWKLTQWTHVRSWGIYIHTNTHTYTETSQCQSLLRHRFGFWLLNGVFSFMLIAVRGEKCKAAYKKCKIAQMNTVAMKMSKYAFQN